MNTLQIYPGALNIKEDEGLLYKEICAARRQDLPKKADLGEIPLIIRHQYKLPICTGEAGAYLRSILYYQEKQEIINFSGMFIYKMNRLFYDGLSAQTKGSTLKATMQTLVNRGVCRENSYNSNYYTLRKPFFAAGRKCDAILKEAKTFTINNFARLESLDDILLALANGLPVVFSLIIFTDFLEAKQGVVSSQIKGQKIGGHAMVALGYDFNTEQVRVVQSWGKNLPTNQGYMYIPFSWFKAKIKNQTPLLIEAYVPL